MGLGTRLSQAAEVIVAALVIAMIAGQLLGQPAVVGYVETGSMSPTLEPGDGFVAVPAALAGPIEEGDVVTFRAEQLHGGGLTTHRVVGETERGYVTRGDANPFTDQDGVEPPVKDDQIVAVAWQPAARFWWYPESALQSRAFDPPSRGHSPCSPSSSALAPCSGRRGSPTCCSP